MTRFLVVVAAIIAMASAQAATTLLQQGSVWKYWDKGSEPLGWSSTEYIEPAETPWGEGPGELGYGDGDEATVVSYGGNATAKYITTYFRRNVEISNPAEFSSITLRLWRDDGAVVYVNGAEVFRSNMPPGTVNYSTLAPTAIEETVDQVALGSSLFVAGSNLVAVEVHQANATSTDVSFDLELIGNGQVVRGPYLQLGTPNSVVVRWRTASPTESVVRFGTSPDTTTWSSVGGGNSTTEHEVLVSGLSPAQNYFYSIGNDAGALASGPDYTFYTTPAAGSEIPVRVWVLGDSGTADVNARAVRNAYYNFAGSLYTDLLLMLGDNAYNNGLDSEYQAAVFDMYPEMLRQTVLWPTIGNHDTAGSTADNPGLPYFSMFTLPTQAEAGGVASGSEKYYSFDYGDIHFVCLDSMTTSRQPGSAMLTWLETDLAMNAKKWIIAFWHHPPYSKGSHDSDNTGADYQMVEMRQNVLPILEAYSVDLVLGGHSHSYERSILLNGHYGFSQSLTSEMKLDSGSGREDASGSYNKQSPGNTAPEGAVYVVAGSSGKISGGALNHPAMFISLNQLGSLVLDVTANKLDVKFLRETGAVTDYFSIVKGNNRPTVSITNPTAGANIPSPANVLVTADAADLDGTVSEVVFYLNGALLGTTTTAPYEVTASNLGAGSYTVTARARDNYGVTALSAPVTFNVTTQPPATPANLQVSTLSSSQLHLTWSDLSSDESGFKVERSTDGANFTLVSTLGANASTFTDGGLSPNTTYYYRVQAFNSGGGSGYTEIASASTSDAAPVAPGNLQAQAVSKSQINLTWVDNSNNELGFTIERKSGKTWTVLATIGPGVTTFANTGLAANTSYTYRVRAYNALGNSAYSNEATARTLRK